MKGDDTLILTAVLSREEDMYIAECPEVGTVSQGGTVEEAVANLKEATELYLAGFPMEEGGGPSSRRLRWPSMCNYIVPRKNLPEERLCRSRVLLTGPFSSMVRL